MAEKTQMTVRPARAADFKFVHRDKEVPAKALRRMIREGDVFVAEYGGKRVGQARLEYLWGKTPFLTSLLVEPEFRRRGVAFALLRHIESLLAGRGHLMLYSSTIPANEAGRSWHTHVGFRQTGYIDRINPDGGGELFFRKRIASRKAGYGVT